MELKWHEKAWDEYLEWQTEDKKTLKKINLLLKDIQRNGNNGIGKTEALSKDLGEWYSKRINGKDRLVYKIKNGEVIIASCKGYYDDK